MVSRWHHEPMASSAQWQHDRVLDWLGTKIFGNNEQPAMPFLDETWDLAPDDMAMPENLTPEELRILDEFEPEREGKSVLRCNFSNSSHISGLCPDGFPWIKSEHPTFKGLSRRVGKLLRHPEPDRRHVKLSPNGYARILDVADACGASPAVVLEVARQGSKGRFTVLCTYDT